MYSITKCLEEEIVEVKDVHNASNSNADLLSRDHKDVHNASSSSAEVQSSASSSSAEVQSSASSSSAEDLNKDPRDAANSSAIKFL